MLMRGLWQQFAPQHRLRKQTLQQRLLDSVRDGSLKARLSRTKLAAIATLAGEAMTIRCITHVLCPLQRANSKMALGAALTELGVSAGKRYFENAQRPSRKSDHPAYGRQQSAADQLILVELKARYLGHQDPNIAPP